MGWSMLSQAHYLQVISDCGELRTRLYGVARPSRTQLLTQGHKLEGKGGAERLLVVRIHYQAGKLEIKS